MLPWKERIELEVSGYRQAAAPVPGDTSVMADLEQYDTE